MRVMVVGVLVALASGAMAQGRDRAFEDAVEQRLGARSPQAVEVWRQATAALDRHDPRVAEAGYREVLRLVPDFPDALRRLSYVVRGPEEALTLARKARALDDTSENASAVLTALLRGRVEARKSGAAAPPSAGDEARTLAVTLLQRAPDKAHTYLLVTETGLELQDRSLLRRGVEGLRRLEPEAMTTHYFGGILAAIEEDWETAQRELERAQALGLPAAEAERLLDRAGIRSHARNWRYLRYAGYAALAWAAGLVLLLLVGTILSRLTLSAVERLSPDATAAPAGGARAMRRLYAVVLGITSFYYYISIPFTLLLVIGAAAALGYAFLMIGRIPIKLALIVLVIVLVTVWAMLKSLFVRRRDEDPGERLTEEQAPGLFALLREVAAAVGTRPVDAVFLVPDVTVAVYERGSYLARLRGRSQRVLVIGLGVLEGMTRTQLRAILAHEYGHFSNQDTAGGDLALHVRRTILHTGEAMARGGAAAWYNPAWLFLNGFYRIYLRVSQGASRLQEVLADRWAAVTAGARAFVAGLRHVVRRSIEFDLLANREVEAAMNEGRPVRNLYALASPEVATARPAAPSAGAEGPPDETPAPAAADEPPPPFEKQVEAALTAAMERPASPYDSHPPPGQRIAWVGRLRGAPEPDDDGTPAWSLFADPAKLQDRMTSLINERLQLAQTEPQPAETAQAEG